MRHNVAISTFLASLIGLSASDQMAEVILRNSELEAETSTSQVVSFAALPTPAVISRSDIASKPFAFVAEDDVLINTARLMIYDVNGTADGSNDKSVADATANQPSTPTTAPTIGGPASSRSEEPDISLTLMNGSVVVTWGEPSHSDDHYLYQPLYLKCEWGNSSVTGDSTSQLFVVYGTNQTKAEAVLQDLASAGDATAGTPSPARDQIVSPVANSPPPTTTTLTSTTSTPQTSQPGATLGIAASLSSNNGLSKGGIIGVAVGASIAGLLVAGALAWLFCLRRRRHRSNAATHHIVPSYSSDVGVHAMISDKEIPAVHESSSPQSVYDGRPSGDAYAPYSDRSAASPVPPLQHQHRRATSGSAATAAAAAAAAAGTGTTSETDLSRNGRGAPTPTSMIATRYAHLVEEGMTEDEIRRLEEEERQLDAAIEHAGQRGPS
ncbi:hypothetical protein F5Y03DRAFT_399456 [Xylaria venustula]|nr:hypothetical protein F5Y03DRAFT_399456 [Xylaria venustula]